MNFLISSSASALICSVFAVRSSGFIAYSKERVSYGPASDTAGNDLVTAIKPPADLFFAVDGAFSGAEAGTLAAAPGSGLPRRSTGRLGSFSSDEPAAPDPFPTAATSADDGELGADDGAGSDGFFRVGRSGSCSAGDGVPAVLALPLPFGLPEPPPAGGAPDPGRRSVGRSSSGFPGFGFDFGCLAACAASFSSSA